MTDGTVIVWYAAICGILGAVAPSLGGTMLRLGIGALVGVAAATLLPLVRVSLGL
ncbi:hypothetical protein FP2506_06936 [Fulvimarina pelagi HTCC2506]|uniref:Uncharacterized protein n=1 Tax=Fulvimarina pelagi HTCC2506 TaxID=314231 RepID=Q0G709_9HYPH|nr:hypothetical protein [Fulvimarina pelagi]EAU42555.1 hypothetical protein FP2506_06936 [Fulvimarina pelagi HTCC2506]